MRGCKDVWRVRCAETCRASAGARASPLCHCEERSDVAIRSPRSKAKRKAILWANPKSATNLPKQQPICRVSLRGRGLPHQCAHWFAMTCRRQKGVCACKDVARKVRRNLPGVSECRDVWHARCAEICRVSASARASPHCHCEERSDGTIRSPRSKAKRKAILWANAGSVTNLP